jgi:hypothetical protein
VDLGLDLGLSLGLGLDLDLGLGLGLGLSLGLGLGLGLGLDLDLDLGLGLGLGLGLSLGLDLGLGFGKIKYKRRKNMGKTLEVSDETYEKIKNQLLEEEKRDFSSLDDLIGGKFFFRTVTYHLIGKVEKIVGKIAVLKNASWVANSGRFMNAIKDGTLEEVEPVGDCFVNLDTVTDFFPWGHDLPQEQK